MAAFKAAVGDKQGWMDELWTCAREVPQTFVQDSLEAWLDWQGDKKDFERPCDDLDELDHEVLYLQDYPDDMPELKSSVDLEGSVYDWLGVTLASTMVSTDTKTTNEMFSLSMGMLGTPAPHALGAPPAKALATPLVGHDAPDSVSGNYTLQAAEQFKDMFKVPNPVARDASPRASKLDVRALMAEVKFQSSRRKLPPSPVLVPPPEALDKRNMVLQKLIETGAIPSKSSKPKGDDGAVKEVVLDPTNWDPLYLNQETALDAMRERHRREYCSSSAGSGSSSGKHHHSSSHSWDEIDPKKGKHPLWQPQYPL